MKKIAIALFTFLSCLVFSQKKELEGIWILDKYTLSDGNLLYANDRNFSKFSRYEFKDNKMVIDDLSFSIKVTDQFISSENNKIQYEFKDKYLLLKTSGDDKIGYFLKPSDFLKIYPEFEPRKEVYDGREVLVENFIAKPEFSLPGGFDAYLRKSFSNFEKFPKAVNEFVVQFIVTKDAKIKDIKIIKSVSDKFDEMAVKKIENSEKYFSNSYNHDFLITKKVDSLFMEILMSPIQKKVESKKKLKKLSGKLMGFMLIMIFRKQFLNMKNCKQLNKKINVLILARNL